MAVGIQEIDDQHRRLFTLLSDFYTSLQKGAGREIQAKMLEDLMTHAGEHFREEESYLQNHPDFTHHRQQHYGFIKQMNQFERDYLHGGITLAVDVVNYVADWLQTHISDVDKHQFLDLK